MIGSMRTFPILTWRCFSLIVFLLGALALGGTGYSSDAHADVMQTADMVAMTDHDCCPDGTDMVEPDGSQHAQPCDDMDGCSGHPCNLASSFSTLIPSGPASRLAPGPVECTARQVPLRPVSNSPDKLERPPRA